MGLPVGELVTYESMTERPALYLLEAFGLHDQWVRWRIARGCFDDDGRLTARALPEDIGDVASLALARRLGIEPAAPDPLHQHHIDRIGLRTGWRR